MENKEIKHLIISKRLIKINSLLVAIIISANILAIAINLITGLNNTVIIPFIVCSLISFVINRKQNLVIVIPLSLFFLIYFLLSYLQIGASPHWKDYLMSFFAFGITSFIVTSQPFEVKKIMKYITLIYVFTSWIFLFLDLENMLPGNKMGLGYLILPVILVCIYQLFYIKIKSSQKLYYFIIIVWYGYFMMKVGTRGAFLSIGLYIFLLFVITKKITINRIIIYLLGLGTLIFVYTNILPLLLVARNLLENLNIKSNFIEKSVLLIEGNNVFNGRDILYESAFNGFKESWFYGKGIGFFHDHYGTYIHNIFLQMLNESGVLLIIPFVFLILYCIFLLFLSKKIDQSFKLFICFIFSLAIPKLIVSSIYWKEQGFWILIIMIISFKMFKNYRFSKV
ncbi:O-antigen ligase family protein [Peribacillus sp. NPDC096448]|uniref:O-antigen ligase family protein n=1 Tax=Peribacillus sp. NPDC096448 TaxID=3364395 RepID=UPI0037FAE920